MKSIKDAAKRVDVRTSGNGDVSKLEEIIEEESGKIKSGLPLWYVKPLVLLEYTGIGPEWLVRPLVRLNNVTPLELMLTEDGAKQVEEILYRFIFGVYS